MKVGVIYFSKTGHTAKLAEKTVEQLRQAGHDVDVWRLETSEPLSLSAERATVREMPDISSLDALAIGTPVHGGRISAPVLTFIEKSDSFAGKPVGFFLTHIFPRKFSAHVTIDALERLGKEKGGKILGSVDVTWFAFGRNKKVNSAAKALTDLYADKN